MVKKKVAQVADKAYTANTPTESNLKFLLDCHNRLISARDAVSSLENALSAAAQKFLSCIPVRATARKLGLTPAYISDIRAGRRKVSDEFVEKLKGLRMDAQ